MIVRNGTLSRLVRSKSDFNRGQTLHGLRVHVSVHTLVINMYMYVHLDLLDAQPDKGGSDNAQRVKANAVNGELVQMQEV